MSNVSDIPLCVFNDIVNRLEKLETNKNYQIDENRKISRRVDEISDFIDGLRDSFNHLSSLCTKRQPHKCPVCDGEGRTKCDPPLRRENAVYFSMSCVACKETGIVWG